MSPRIVFVRPAGTVYAYSTRGGVRYCPTLDLAVARALRYARKVGARVVRVTP